MIWFTFALADTPDPDPVESPAPSTSQPVEEVVVYADLRQRPDGQTTSSTTVIGADTAARRGATHLEELLNVVPNINFASGSSRARFFQIRGIGERSQFEEPLNPSVGLVIDGIDMTGLGTVATLVDVEQVEVLRGPQGTLYGANALAGLIHVSTTDPTDRWEGRATVGVANYDTLRTEATLNAPLAPNLAVRLSGSYLRSDGFITNTTLGRDDTMGRDERTLRAKLRWTPSPNLTATLTAFRAQADNGYDAFNFDNDRITLSDEPGRDTQDTLGFGTSLRWSSPFAVVEARTSLALSDVLYSYDEDWTYVGYHPDGYSSTDSYARTVGMRSTDLRVLSGEEGALLNGSTDWVLGVYTYDKEVELTRRYTYFDDDFQSTNRWARWAAYGETTTRFAVPFSVSLGMRAERNRITYDDNRGAAGSPKEWLWGGKLAARYSLEGASLYGLVSRGYKPGGFNADPSLPDDLRTYATESLWNLETGVKTSWLAGRSRAKLALFYQTRERVQSNGSLVIVRDDGSTAFIDYTENADRGFNAGAELEADVQLAPPVRIYGSLGLLETRIWSTTNPDAPYHGRRQAHAPFYQGLLGLRFDRGPLFGGVEMEGKDAFYFSTRHDVTSRPYVLANAHFGLRIGESLEIRAWGRNLNDAITYTRGFGSFGNDPANGWETEPYYQLGEPRRFGVQITGYR